MGVLKRIFTSPREAQKTLDNLVTEAERRAREAAREAEHARRRRSS
jgi:hypothetical protein